MRVRELNYELRINTSGRVASSGPSENRLDLTMPEMNGLAYRAHQLAEGRIGDVPVVIVTGTAVCAEENQRLQAVDYLAKPVGREELVRVVARYCRTGR
jgi:CheY-like chemotaxis protein